MAADVQLQIWGMGHLAGATVGVVVAGVYMGSYAVASDGSVVVSYGADVSGKVTAAYLTANFGPSATAVGSQQDTTFSVFDGTNTLSVTVPVLVGLLYSCVGMTLRPVAGDNGPSLGKVRRANLYAALVEDAIDFQGGTTLSNVTAATMTSDGGLTPENALADDQPYTGILVAPVSDVPGFDTQFVWQTTQPYRCTVSMVSLFHVSADR